jgi:hypothetical protein
MVIGADRTGYTPDMPRIISSVRGAVLHAVWYLDWRTGGNTVLVADRQATS